jgi:4-carboxymuconolactone decarboxylase
MTTPTITIRPDAGLHTSRAHRSIVVRANVPVDDAVQDVAPDLGRSILDAAVGDASDRPGLDPRSRELSAIAAFVTVGTPAPVLRQHIRFGLDAGLTREEIVEAITRVGIPRAGFASALEAIGVAREVFGEHGGTQHAA